METDDVSTLFQLAPILTLDFVAPALCIVFHCSVSAAPFGRPLVSVSACLPGSLSHASQWPSIFCSSREVSEEATVVAAVPCSVALFATVYTCSLFKHHSSSLISSYAARSDRKASMILRAATTAALLKDAGDAELALLNC
jgi:hypothetical protein